ncbi:hypothetical protein GCM10010274_60150 [Streptomyces lavendofoliae]|uniref:Uncharacterized protein n=1 Tax=Streptomyces lavendofoliae TaxID=67314 RepID=A0A918I3B8_9ACTN|nr:hypothetical protein GCM10010274_60150 [Streptomyces lavendofoliae]
MNEETPVRQSLWSAAQRGYHHRVRRRRRVFFELPDEVDHLPTTDCVRNVDVHTVEYGLVYEQGVQCTASGMERIGSEHRGVQAPNELHGVVGGKITRDEIDDTQAAVLGVEPRRTTCGVVQMDAVSHDEPV